MSRFSTKLAAALFGATSVVAILASGSAALAQQVQDVKASDGVYEQEVLITWAPVIDVYEYIVQRRGPSSLTWKTVAHVPYTKTDCWDDTAVPCVVYKYRVYVDGTTDYSHSDDGYAAGNPPPGPTVAASADGQGQIALAWAAIPEATSYEVYRAETQAGDTAWIKTVSTPGWVDQGLPPCKAYWYSVRACSPCGCGTPATPAPGYSVGTPISEAPSVHVSTDQAGEVVLTWDPVPLAMSYAVVRADTQTGSYLEAPLSSSVSSTSWTDTTSAGCREHWYRVAACSDCGVGPWSDPTVGHSTASAVELPKWTVSEVISGYCSVTLSWSEVPEATYYDLKWTGPAVLASEGWMVPTTVTPVEGLSHVVSSPPRNECSGVSQYSIRACNCSGCGSWAPFDRQVRWGGFDLPEPAGLTATQTMSASGWPGIVLDWEQVPGATEYEVAAGTQSPHQSLSLSGTVLSPTFADTDGKLCDTTYWVRACCGCGCSPSYATVQAQKQLPTAVIRNLTVSDQTHAGPIYLFWDAVEDTGGFMTSATAIYLVERTAEGLPPASFTTTEPEFRDVSALLCQTYSYTMRACTGCGCGPASVPVYGYRGPPAATVSATSDSDSATFPVVVQWFLVSEATSYEVRRTDMATGIETVIATVAVPFANNEMAAYSDCSPLIPCVPYEYRVFPCNSCGCAAPLDASVGVRRIFSPPPTWIVAESVSSSGSFTSVRATWEPVPGASMYRVTVAWLRPAGYDQSSTAEYLVDGPEWTSDLVYSPSGTGVWIAVRTCNQCTTGASAHSAPFLLTLP
jgi:hypothetical protein